jgi:hypothetical protein
MGAFLLAKIWTGTPGTLPEVYGLMVEIRLEDIKQICSFSPTFFHEKNFCPAYIFLLTFRS